MKSRFSSQIPQVRSLVAGISPARNHRMKGRPTVARYGFFGIMVAIVGLGLASCSSSPTPQINSSVLGQQVSASTWTSPGPSTVPSFYNVSYPLKSEPQGTIIRYQQIKGVPGFPGNAKLYRILYYSKDIYSNDIAVSGYIALPNSKAPSGGRPIITWAHGTTGVARICAPSIFTNAPDASGIYLAPDLVTYLNAGYVVAATDYQGLGGPGIHPYLVGQSEGQNVLDAALAARKFPNSDTSNKVVIVGHSQGGQSALFAGQLAPSYASSLNVVGTVAIAPLTEVQEALPVALKLGKGELGLLASAGFAWAKTYHDLPMTSVFYPSAISKITSLETSTCESQVQKGIETMPTSQIILPTFATNPALEAHLRENSPGLIHTNSPILILQGLSDTTIPAILAETFEANQCPQVSDNLALRLYPGATHSGVLRPSAADMLTWISQRFSGQPVTPGCSKVTA